jgi:hypothetical protein
MINLDRLVTWLNQAGIQTTNIPLYQVIVTLIKAAQEFQKEQSDTNAGTSGILNNATFLTVNNELASLPFSRRLSAGTRITFDDSVFGIRTANVPINEIVLTGANEVATLPNSRQLLAGTGITFDDSVANQRTINSAALPGYWTLLTDGDIDETDFIFAGGDAISVFVPL